MKKQHLTTMRAFEETMKAIAPLPCQEDYAFHLAAILTKHLHRNQLIDRGIAPDMLPTASAIVVAPTGSGKTHLLRKMTQQLGINLVTVDCTSLVAEGYKGVSVSEHLSQARKAADSPSDFARSVVFFDEVDKLAREANYRWDSMPSLLQLFNGGTMATEGRLDGKSIDVSRFALLFGGAFVGLEKIIRKRVCPTHSGNYGSKPMTDEELMLQVTLEDLAEYGILPELLGRIGTVLTIAPMGVEDYRKLLRGEAGTALREYDLYLRSYYNVAFDMTENAEKILAQMCMESTFGARAVRPLVEQLMEMAIVHVEEDADICKVILDADDLDRPVIRYVYGPRCYTPKMPGDEESVSYNNDAPPMCCHTIRAKTEEHLLKKLRRYHWCAGGDSNHLLVLMPFLECTVAFLHRKCRPSEFTMDNIIKLAKATLRENPRSPYDIIAADNGLAHLPSYRRFSGLYNDRTTDILVESLERIRDYIHELHLPCQIRMEVLGKPDDTK